VTSQVGLLLTLAFPMFAATTLLALLVSKPAIQIFVLPTLAMGLGNLVHNRTRYHGIFAPHSKYRALLTPAQRGQGRKVKARVETADQTPAARRASMTWAQRLQRVFNIDIASCSACGGEVKVIACIRLHGCRR